jgi:hypothetical protein
MLPMRWANTESHPRSGSMPSDGCNMDLRARCNQRNRGQIRVWSRFYGASEPRHCHGPGALRTILGEIGNH